MTMVSFCQRLALALTRVWVSFNSFSDGIFMFTGESATPPPRVPNKSSTAPQTAAAAALRKRKRAKSEDDGEAACVSRSGSKKALPLNVFGDTGRENQARLNEQIEAMRLSLFIGEFGRQAWDRAIRIPAFKKAKWDQRFEIAREQKDASGA